MIGDELLEGELVRLTALTKNDLPQLAEWFANMELRRLVDADQVVPWTLEDTRDWYDSVRQQRERYTFAIRTLADERFIGHANVRSIIWTSKYGKVGIAIGDPSLWGQGYGTDALRVLLKYAFMELGLNRVELKTLGYNTRAIRSFEKIGFQHEGALRQAICRDGKFYDIVQMAILRREWEALYLPV